MHFVSSLPIHPARLSFILASCHLERSAAALLIDEAVSDLLLALLEQDCRAENEQDVDSHNTEGTCEHDIEEVVGEYGERTNAANIRSSDESSRAGGVGYEWR